MHILAPAVPSLLLVAAVLPAQTVLAVPASFPTIQSAIAAAAAGDHVVVAPGTWVENINFLGKAITVRSSGGASVTTIDGNQAGCVVTFAANETLTSVLDGFTITNGLGATTALRSRAGGVSCISASPTIRNCIVTGNTGGAGAPGVSTFNSGIGGAGGPGGILASPSSLLLVDVQVAGNTGGAGGVGAMGGFGLTIGGRGGPGGAYFSFEQPATIVVVHRCHFVDNVGGTGGSATSTTSTATGGTGGAGGVELFTMSDARFTQTVIASNDGGDGGLASGLPSSGGFGGNGGFDFSSSTALGTGQARLLGCAVVGNVGGDAVAVGFNHGGRGGGATGATAFTAVSTTFAGNVAGVPVLLLNGVSTGGLTVGGYMVSSAALTNCILWGNLAAGAPSDLHSQGIAAQANACDIGASIGTVVGSGSISADPLFANLAAGDVHLTAASPCRDVGIPHALLPVFDYEGDPRVTGSATDMGADEFDGLPGSREALALAVTVNGGFPPTLVTASPAAGDLVSVTVTSPGGAFPNDVALVASEVWFPPTQPVPALPDFQLSPGFSIMIVWGAGVGSGAGFGAHIPPGLGGLALRLQAFCLTPAARNGMYASSAARDVVF